MFRYGIRFTTLALAAMLAACNAGDTTAPAGFDADDELTALLGAGAGGSPEARGTRGSGVPLFDRLAGEIPAFGGLYRTAPCSISLVLTDGADVDHAIRVVLAVVEPLVARSCPDGIRVHPVRGDFTWLELNRYRVVAAPLLAMPGVGGMAIDIPLNRIVVTVASRDVMEDALAALERLGADPEAFTFRIRTRPATSTR
jgi:hypothetical protein